jgi:ABC-type dipeptide/oligopeptide/nickel transport system permease subunit
LPSRVRTPAPETLGTAAGREFTVKARSQRQIVFRRFRQHKAAVASLAVFVLIVLFAFVGPLVWSTSPTFMSNDIFTAPDPAHPFGTDSTGIDLLSAVMKGTQSSLIIALVVSIASTAFGAVYGAVSGFYGGWTDTIMMRIADLFLTFPIIAVAIMLDNRFQAEAGSLWLLIAVLAALFWPGAARVIRAQVLSLKEKEFVEAARALGARDRRIIFRHLLPNTLGSIIVIATLTVAGTILTETALSFLGFGVQFPNTSLGLLVTSNQTAIEGGHPWLFYIPGVFIILIALTVNFIGDGLRDAFDPQQTRVRA